MKKQERYLIGYEDDLRTAWGKDREDGSSYVDTLSLRDATRKARKDLTSIHVERVVYKLVPVLKVGRLT